MEDREQSASNNWLNAHAPGFGNLPLRDRNAIFDFSFLWSLFESQIMENYARADRIRDKVDHWSAENTLDTSIFEEELDYFHQRYFSNGSVRDSFQFLKFRASDHEELVLSVLSKKNESPRDKMLCLLMIVWRLRNNLFHGEKWAYQLRGQFHNFTYANSILMKILERHGRI